MPSRPHVAHLGEVLLQVARVRFELDLSRDREPEPDRFVTEEVGVVASRRTDLPEHADLLEVVLEQPVRAHDAFGRDVAVRDRVAVVTRELVRAGPTDHGHADLVRDRLQRQAVVGDHRTEDDDAALLDEPLVAVDQLAVVLARQPARVARHDRDRRAAPCAFVERVLEGEDGRVDPVGEQLPEVHVDEHADLHRLERIALGLHAARRWVDDDLRDRLLRCAAAAFVPAFTRAAGTLEVGARPETHVAHGAVRLRDAVIHRRGKHALGVGVLLVAHGCEH